MEQPAVAAAEKAYADEITLVKVSDVDVWPAFGVLNQQAWGFVDDSGDIEMHYGGLEEAELFSRIDALLAK